MGSLNRSKLPRVHERRAQVFRGRPAPVHICHEANASDGGKNRYATRSVAKNVLKKLSSKGRAEKRVYYCKGCAGYHPTSRPLGEKRKRGTDL